MEKHHYEGSQGQNPLHQNSGRKKEVFGLVSPQRGCRNGKREDTGHDNQHSNQKLSGDQQPLQQVISSEKESILETINSINIKWLYDLFNQYQFNHVEALDAQFTSIRHVLIILRELISREEFHQATDKINQLLSMVNYLNSLLDNGMYESYAFSRLRFKQYVKHFIRYKLEEMKRQIVVCSMREAVDQDECSNSARLVKSTKIQKSTVYKELTSHGFKLFGSSTAILAFLNNPTTQHLLNNGAFEKLARMPIAAEGVNILEGSKVAIKINVSGPEIHLNDVEMPNGRFKELQDMAKKHQCDIAEQYEGIESETLKGLLDEYSMCSSLQSLNQFFREINRERNHIKVPMVCQNGAANLTNQAIILKDRSFVGNNLVFVNFSNSDLSGSNFRDSHVYKANFYGCTLFKSDISMYQLTMALIGMSSYKLFHSVKGQKDMRLEKRVKEATVLKGYYFDKQRNVTRKMKKTTQLKLETRYKHLVKLIGETRTAAQCEIERMEESSNPNL